MFFYYQILQYSYKKMTNKNVDKKDYSEDN